MKQQIQEAKAEARLKRERALEKAKLNEMNIETSKTLNVGLERQLRKVATRGVVALFNAIRKHQTSMRSKAKTPVKKSKTEEDVNKMSKSGFLDLLRKGTEDLEEDEV